MATHIKLNEREWKKLIEKINKEEVVLVLGDELSTLNVNGKQILLKDYLLDHLIEALNDEETDSSKFLTRDEIKSFSDISYDYKRERWQKIKSDPYTETKEVLTDISPKLYETDALKKLLSIDKFKTILTTSFDDIAYSVLKDIYGENDVATLGYVKKTNGEDISPKSGKRIIYHLFGKPNSEQHSYVLTEDDLLEFIHFWMDQNYRPKQLSNLISDKYILVIGCSYPDWLFRFFFHSLKYTDTIKNNYSDNGLLADRDLDEELISFLRRMETSVHEDALNFIDELHKRWSAIIPSDTESSENDENNEDFEALISYASEDYEIAFDIAQTFKEMGLNVWFDKKDLEGGDKYERLIKNRINKIRTFIPILSPSTDSTEGGRFFRKEWKWAKDAEESHFGAEDNFIRPILIEGYTMNEDHVFNDCHCTDLSDPIERKGKIRRMVRNIRK